MSRMLQVSLGLAILIYPVGLGAQQVTSGGPLLQTGAGRVSSPPVLDGILDDEEWSLGQAIEDFVQREPNEGAPVSEATEVKLLYDDEALYVGAWMYDSDATSIVLGETRRDAPLQQTDAFVVVLDTYQDGQNAFVFGTTPAGIEYDGQVTNEGQSGGGGGPGTRRQQSGSGGGFNLNWDGSWEVRTSRNQRGWYAEFRIPFSTLRYEQGGEQEWGLNFGRTIRRKNEEAVWAPIPRQFNLYRVSLAGTLSGFEAPQQRVLTLSPYGLMSAAKDYTVTSPEAQADFQVGGDAKIGLTQSLTLDLTVNTDFAQAEVDDQQINLTRFPLFFPEKRGFFLENAGTFSVGSGQSADLFFSRKIGLAEGKVVPIKAGARLTGKVGDVQLGFLNIQAGELRELNSSGQSTLVAPTTNFGVTRVFRELGNRTRFGGILVSKFNTADTDDYNLTFGADGRLGIGDALTLDGWLSATQTPGRGGLKEGEYAFAGSASYQTRDWQNSISYREVGDEYNPEVGFLPRRAYRFISVRLLRHLRFPSVSWFRELRPHISWREHWDLNGFSETRQVHIDNHFEFSNGAFFQFPGLNITGEGLQEPFEIREGIVIPAGSYNNADFQFRFNTNLSAPLSVQGTADAGGFYSGKRLGTSTTLNYRFQDRFVASTRVSYYDVRLPEGDFVTSLIAVKGSYSFTPRIFLAALLQYNEQTENFGTNIRFGWLDTAGTGLNIVFNDTEHFGSLERTGIAYGPQVRQLIVKYTKMFDIGR